MVQFDNQYRQIKIKIVYYGPALGGKTTCLQYLHGTMDPQRRTRLYTLRTASDRTLFFDLLSLDLGRVRGYKLALQLFTVPGQVQYNATRRAVLAGADGVVFVADSQRSQHDANAESVANLAENLAANGLDPATVPIVVQLNKRDLSGVMTRGEMEADLNPSRHPVVETVATTGVGVLSGLAAVTEATVVAVADRLGLAGQTEALERLIANVRGAFAPYTGGGKAPDEPVVLRPESNASTLREQDLVSEAVRANIAMTELNAQLDRTTRELETRVRQLAFLNEFGRLMSLAREPEDITGGLLDRLLAELRVANGALLVAGGEGGLVELLRRGGGTDPMLAIREGEGTGADLVLASRVAVLVRGDDVDDVDDDTARWSEALRGQGFVSALVVPLVAQGEALGVVTAYADEHRGSFQETDLELASVLAANAAVALSNARAWRQLEQVNRELEGAVAERTSELADALKSAQALAAELEERNAALGRANVRLREMEKLKGDLLSRISHEFNTPVTAIQTAARILARYEEVPSDKAAKFLAVIGAEAERLGELTSSALQAAVLGVPDGHAHAARVPLADLIRRVLASLRSEIGGRDLVVNVKVAAGLDHVDGEASQIESALRAVVKNAVEFNCRGGRVEVAAHPVRRGTVTGVEIRIEDTGSGIAPDELPHVEEVFWQGGSLLTDKPRGLGLGLAVARRVADNHHGTLEIASERGKGTSVTLFLPRLEGSS
jgi:mutual gliding-motility protein MglA